MKRKRTGYVSKPGTVLSAEQVLHLIATSEERAQQDKHKLDEMMHYAESTTCRRQILREYFGEPIGGPCHNCDNCINRFKAGSSEVASSVLERSGATCIETTHGTIFTTSPETLPQLFAVADSTFAPGAVVRHAQFGQGTVKAVEGDTLTVHFRDTGVHRLKSSFVQPFVLSA